MSNSQIHNPTFDHFPILDIQSLRAFAASVLEQVANRAEAVRQLLRMRAQTQRLFRSSQSVLRDVGLGDYDNRAESEFIRNGAPGHR